jgi:hypothetical protein
MKTLKMKVVVVLVFLVAVCAAVTLASQEQQQITIVASLSSADGAAQGDLITVVRSGKIASVSFKNPRRYRGFAIVDRTQLSQVRCEFADSEYGDVHTAGGSWIAVVVCPEANSTRGLDVPTLIQARAASTDPTDSMECWENTELRLGVCYNIGNEVVPRTKEHILLGRPIFP